MTHYEIEYRRSNGDHTDTYGEIDGDKARSLAEGLAAGLLAASGGRVTVYEVTPIEAGNRDCYIHEIGRYERAADGSLIGSGDYAAGATFADSLDGIYNGLMDHHTEPCRCGLWQHTLREIEVGDRPE